MATYLIHGTISVENVRSKKEAITRLQMMLDEYECWNSRDGKDITISWDKVEKETD